MRTDLIWMNMSSDWRDLRTTC